MQDLKFVGASQAQIEGAQDGTRPPTGTSNNTLLIRQLEKTYYTSRRII